MKLCKDCNLEILNRHHNSKYCLKCSNGNYKNTRNIWKSNNKDKMKEYYSNLYKENDKYRLSKYYQENKEDIKQKNKLYRQSDRYINWILEYRKKNKWKDKYRDSLRGVLKRLGINKNDYTNNILGYSDIDFKIHIESLFTSNMNWDSDIEIDHIIPIVAFKEGTPVNIINSLDNLQPLYSSNNSIKYTSIDFTKIELYIKYIDHLTDLYKKEVLQYV